MTFIIPSRQSDAAPAPGCDGELYRRGVLIVEDSVVQRVQLMGLFRRLGVDRIEEATDGNSALRVLRGLPVCPAVAVVDLEMPGMDGIEFAQQLAGLQQRPALVIASHADPAIMEAVETMIRASGLTVLGTVGKPVTAEKMTAVIGRLRTRVSPSKSCKEETDSGCDGSGPLPDDGPDLVYCPQACLRTGQIVAVEALSRDAAMGAVPVQLPNFAAVRAESEPHRLLEFAARRLSMWAAAQQGRSLALTLSSNDLRKPALLNNLLAVLRRTGFSSGQVTMQISQTSLATEDSAILSSINRLRIGGFGLSLNDYCSGYSSIHWLARLPFTEIRIEQELISNAERGVHARLILSSAIELGQHLGLCTVADGVGSVAQMQMLREMGCDRAQGAAIGGPFEAERITAWLHHGGI